VTEPTTDEGVLAPEVAAWLEANPMYGTPLEELVPEILELARGPVGAPPTRDIAHVHDDDVDGIPIRVYRNDGPPTGLVVYFHGGGFVIGSIGLMDNVARELAHGSSAVVVSVGYRLAPEHPYPAGLDDCAAVTEWAFANAARFDADPAAIAVAGVSAGGNLAAAVALRSRIEGPALRAQVLVYPVVSPACTAPSMTENAEGYLLTAGSMREMWAWYLGPDGDANDAFAAVDRAADYAGLPPALVLTAEYDPLRDEGEHYASLLDGFDVDTTVVRYDGMLHGFLGMREIVPESSRAITAIAEFLRKHLE